VSVILRVWRDYQLQDLPVESVEEAHRMSDACMRDIEGWPDCIEVDGVVTERFSSLSPLEELPQWRPA
jgi:hypothetical protein